MRKKNQILFYFLVVSNLFAEDIKLSSTGEAVYNFYYMIGSIIKVMNDMFIKLFLGSDNIFSDLPLFKDTSFLEGIGQTLLIAFFINSLINKSIYWMAQNRNYGILGSFTEPFIHFIIGVTLISNSSKLINGIVDYLSFSISNLNTLLLLDTATLKTMLDGQNFLFSILIGIIYIIPTIIGIMFSFFVMKELITRTLKLFLLRLQAPIYFGLTTSNRKDLIFNYLWSFVSVIFEILPIYLVIYLTKNLPLTIYGELTETIKTLSSEFGTFYSDTFGLDFSKFIMFILNLLVLSLSYIMLKEGKFKKIFNFLGGQG